MRTAWTRHASLASPVTGEAFVSGLTGDRPVTIDQFPAAMLNTAMQPSAEMRKAAYIVAWRRCFAPT
ncbi:hypothetical protein SAMN05216330_1011031 [Bradyrhizobium sp. Ghvi]|nr:hypothetical protein SAMN05216330_1011031 [Bradyrhizobium sp. Ghvi]